MTITRTFILFAVFATSACTQMAEDEIDPNRGPLGKADSFGSCQATDCDGQSPDGNCWCDEACAEFGDCCADKTEVCDAPVSQECGGFLGLACGEGEYCHYDEDLMCGAADHLGTCKPLPEACIEIFAPVCGCDGQTYSNSCFANMAGTSVVHEGECDAPPPAGECGGLAGLACDAGEYCHYEEDQMCGAADQLGTCQPQPEVCIELFAPVCGCDGQTYGNSCKAAAAGVSVVHEGECN